MEETEGAFLERNENLSINQRILYQNRFIGFISSLPSSSTEYEITLETTTDVLHVPLRSIQAYDPIVYATLRLQTFWRRYLAIQTVRSCVSE